MLSEKLLKEWINNKLKNPQTGRTIKLDGPTYKKYEKFYIEMYEINDEINDEEIKDKNPKCESISANDIEIFYTKSTRASNDSTTKKREAILSMNKDKVVEFYTNEIYGSKWEEILGKWYDALSTLTTRKYKKINIEHKGGRRFNYDFDILFEDTSGMIVDNVNVEFKFNCKKISNAPQCLSLKEDMKFIDKSYAEYFYDYYLHQIIEGLENMKPDKKSYLKNVYKTNYKVDPLFEEMYNLDKDVKNADFRKKKSEIVDESIASYLEEYGSSIDVDKVIDDITSRNSKKIFVLWCPVEKIFNIESMDFTSKYFKFDRIQNNNVIVLSNRHKQEYHLLLRWKNHKGVLLPAWQIKHKIE